MDERVTKWFLDAYLACRDIQRFVDGLTNFDRFTSKTVSHEIGHGPGPGPIPFINDGHHDEGGLMAAQFALNAEFLAASILRFRNTSSWKDRQ